MQIPRPRSPQHVIQIPFLQIIPSSPDRVMIELISSLSDIFFHQVKSHLQYLRERAPFSYLWSVFVEGKGNWNHCDTGKC